LAQAEGSAGGDRARRLELAGLWIVLSLAPALLAALSWDPAQIGRAWQRSLAFYHLPALAVELVAIILAVMGRVGPLTVFRRLPLPVQVGLGIVLAIAYGTTFLVAPSPGPALIHTVLATLHLLFGLSLFGLASSYRRSPSEDARLWLWAGLGCVGYGLVLTAFVPAIPDERTFDWRVFGLGVSNLRQIGFFAIVGACAGLGLAAQSKDRRWFLTGLTIASIMVAVNVWSGSRGPLVAIAGAFALAMVALPGLDRNRAAAAFVLSLALGVALSRIDVPDTAYCSLERIIGANQLATPELVTSGRLSIWLGTIREIFERPLFGYGAAQFKTVVAEGRGVFNSPHNFPLQFWLQWGLVGGSIALAALAYWWFRFMLRARIVAGSAPAVLVVNALLIFGLFDVTFFYAYPIAMIIGGMVLVQTADTDEKP